MAAPPRHWREDGYLVGGEQWSFSVGWLTVHPDGAAFQNGGKIRAPAATGFVQNFTHAAAGDLGLDSSRYFPDLSEEPQPGQGSGRVDFGETVLDDDLIR